VKIEFSIGDTPATLRRHWFSGGMKIDTPNGSFWVQHPMRLSTHFSFRLTQSWERTIEGRVVRIEKTRPLLAGGARPQTYRIFIDGEAAGGSHGY
jgi:hypothetical protein